jgi:hypothetical protein
MKVEKSEITEDKILCFYINLSICLIKQHAVKA